MIDYKGWMFTPSTPEIAKYGKCHFCTRKLLRIGFVQEKEIDGEKVYAHNLCVKRDGKVEKVKKESSK